MVETGGGSPTNVGNGNPSAGSLGGVDDKAKNVLITQQFQIDEGLDEDADEFGNDKDETSSDESGDEEGDAEGDDTSN